MTEDSFIHKAIHLDLVVTSLTRVRPSCCRMLQIYKGNKLLNLC